MNTAILSPRAAALERIKSLVLDTLPSPESKRAYRQALDDFFRILLRRQLTAAQTSE